MPRYVNLDKVEKFRRSYCNTTNMSHCNRNCAECYYNNGGAEDVVPIVHAKWERVYRRIDYIFLCSACMEIISIKNCKYNFCPNCGAKMDKE